MCIVCIQCEFTSEQAQVFHQTDPVDLANLATAYNSGIDPFAFEHPIESVATDCDYCGEIRLCHPRNGGTCCMSCKRTLDNGGVIE